MSISTQTVVRAAPTDVSAPFLHTWTGRIRLLWSRRRRLFRVVLVAAPLSCFVVLVIPKQYEAAARLMPPDSQNSAAPMLAALASRSGGLSTLGTLAGGLLGARPTTALFVNFLQSGTVTGELVRRFQLQSVYGKRYAVDAQKKLSRKTRISDDKKSGVITILVEDHDPTRARDLVQGYLDELNRLVIQTNNSSAHQERVFIEQRLRSVTADLQNAQQAMGDYASRNNTVDLKEQTRAMVDAGARVEAALVLEQSTLNSLREVYGDQNVRVREAEARVATLRHELDKVSGSSVDASAPIIEGRSTSDDLYPPLRRLPRLAVPYADLYRKVRVQEELYELLTQQYEAARIEEAKNTPAVAVIDRPSVPEKKSFPPRTLLAVILTSAAVLAAAAWILLSEAYRSLPNDNELRILVHEIRTSAESERGRAI